MLHDPLAVHCRATGKGTYRQKGANMPYYRITQDRDGWRARIYGANGELLWWTGGVHAPR